MKYVILRDFLTKSECNQLIKNTKTYNNPIQLNIDGECLSNTWIPAQERNKGLSYRYQNDNHTLTFAEGISKKIYEITGIAMPIGNLKEKFLTFCHYGNDGRSVAHRDRDKSLDRIGQVKFQEYSVIILLTNRGRDYVGEDTFFMNFANTIVSEDGKEVRERYDTLLGFHGDRVYPKLTKGDCIIFKNDISVHGVDTITVRENQQGRITIGLRSL